MVEFDPIEYTKMATQFLEDETQFNFLSKQLVELKEKKKRLRETHTHAIEAREIIQQVSKETVSNLEVHLSSLGTMAMSTVTHKWPDFVAEVKIQRNQVELHLMFEEHGVQQKPLDSSGHGPCDVSDYAMQVAFWCLDKNRPTLLLDEPFRNVSPSYQRKVSNMIKKITEELRLQQIMISHAEDINTSADKTFILNKKGQISHVTVEENNG